MKILEKRHAKRICISNNAVLNNRNTQIKKHTTMHTKNTIHSLFEAKGFKRVVPTDEVLQKLNMTLHRFNKILENKVKMTLEEAAAFALWLNVSIEELTTTPTHQTHSLAEKFGLNT